VAEKGDRIVSGESGQSVCVCEKAHVLFFFFLTLYVQSTKTMLLVQNMSIVYNGMGARGKKPPISDTSYSLFYRDS
jgi:hypothetical protein